jgi:hypothetical protein
VRQLRRVAFDQAPIPSGRRRSPNQQVLFGGGSLRYCGGDGPTFHDSTGRNGILLEMRGVEVWRMQRKYGNSATADDYFLIVTLPDDFPVSMSPACNTVGGRRMSIDTLILILAMTFAIGFVLDRLDLPRGL